MLFLLIIFESRMLINLKYYDVEHGFIHLMTASHQMNFKQAVISNLWEGKVM